MNNLTEMMLGDVCRLGAGNAFPKDKQGNNSGEIPFIKVSDFELPGNEVKINRANNYVSASTASELRLKRYRKGSTVFAKIGIALTYNRRRKLCSDTAVDNNLMVAEADPGVVSDDYLYYLLRTIDFNLIANGSAIPYLNAGDIKKIPVLIHDKHEQESITRILKTLDDKIELSRKSIETLEGMAMALFKSWFVDFDPVRAKAKGRPTGLPYEIDELFPDSLEELELGEIPSGWEWSYLDEIATNPRNMARPGEMMPTDRYIGLEHMPRGSICLSEYGEAENLESNKNRFQKGDLLYGKLRPYFKKTGSALFDGVCSTDIVVVRAKQECLKGFTCCLLASDPFIDFTVAASSGTRMPRTSWKDMSEFTFCLPKKSLLEIFESLFLPQIQRIQFGSEQNKILGAIRDALLPRLISGELRVPDAEKMLEEAGV